MTKRPHPTEAHPSQYSPEVLTAIAPVLRRFQLPVHDPFAGTGVRLAALCDQLGLPYTGTELVAAFIADGRVNAGDSTDSRTYPEAPFVVCTSPVYPNGMADHFKASEPEGRHTYRQALHLIQGHDTPLNERNMGRYSVRRGSKSFETYAALAFEATTWWWPNPVVLNVSDFYVGDDVFPLVRFWRGLLSGIGYMFAADIEIRTRRQRRGANGDRRVDHELVLVGFPKHRKPEATEADKAAGEFRKLRQLLGSG